jgi:hypothetical protein
MKRTSNSKTLRSIFWATTATIMFLFLGSIFWRYSFGYVQVWRGLVIVNWGSSASWRTPEIRDFERGLIPQWLPSYREMIPFSADNYISFSAYNYISLPGHRPPPPPIIKELAIPILPIAILSLLISIVWSRAPRAIPRHLCSSCRYDLKGNVSGRCPECGQEIDKLREGANSARLL